MRAKTTADRFIAWSAKRARTRQTAPAGCYRALKEKESTMLSSELLASAPDSNGTHHQSLIQIHSTSLPSYPCTLIDT